MGQKSENLGFEVLDYSACLLNSIRLPWRIEVLRRLALWAYRCVSARRSTLVHPGLKWKLRYEENVLYLRPFAFRLLLKSFARAVCVAVVTSCPPSGDRFSRATDGKDELYMSIGFYVPGFGWRFSPEPCDFRWHTTIPARQRKCQCSCASRLHTCALPSDCFLVSRFLRTVSVRSP
jgi:hypothetical protein